MKTKVIGQHRITSHNGRLMLSKNNFVQSAIDETSENQFDLACDRLETYYQDFGSDFVANGEFVNFVLRG